MAHRAVMGSLIVHGVVIALVLGARAPVERPPPIEVASATEIEVVQGDHAITQLPTATGEAGGKPSNTDPPERYRAARSSLRPPHRPPAVTAREDPAGVVETTVSFEQVGIGDAASSDTTGEGGEGHGRGWGRGVGDQLTTSSNDAAALVAKMPIPTVEPDRAQPPVLTWPARNEDAPDEDMYIARITIDTDGFVVGARLLRGRGGAGDLDAENAIWRFRYRPARDAHGRPVKVTIEQRFLLGWR